MVYCDQTMETLFLILGANFIISCISLAGLVALSSRFLNKGSSTILVSFAAGVLLATAFLNIMPEALEGLSAFTSLSYVMYGVIGAFLMERSLLWYHHHHDDSHDINPTSILVLVGDGIHNFIDGMAIAAAFLVNPVLGVTTTLAIAAHEIPQELADYSVLRHCGLSRKKALLWNFLSGLTAIAGGLIGYFLFQESFHLVYVALSLTAGIFIYVSAADLIPELHHSAARAGWIKQTLVFLVGVALMYSITVHMPHGHEEEQNMGHVEELQLTP